MGKHTPGPWVLLPLEGKYYGTKVQIGKGYIEIWGTEPKGEKWEASDREKADGWNAEDYGFDHVERYRDLANARLIAAAPELLEACKAALHESGAAYCSEDCDSPAEKLIRAAIAKAEGKE